MSLHAAYVIGRPGSGKSSLVDHLTRALPVDTAEQPFAHRRYDCGVFELGRRRKEFSGTDALSMSVQPEVTKFIEGIRPRLLLAEGDRLANNKFFSALIELGYDLRIYCLEGPKVDIQRTLRDPDSQDPTWLKGRDTKVRRLRTQWSARVTMLEAGARLATLEEQMTDPVFMQLRAARALGAGVD